MLHILKTKLDKLINHFYYIRFQKRLRTISKEHPVVDETNLAEITEKLGDVIHLDKTTINSIRLCGAIGNIAEIMHLDFADWKFAWLVSQYSNYNLLDKDVANHLETLATGDVNRNVIKALLDLKDVSPHQVQYNHIALEEYFNRENSEV